MGELRYAYKILVGKPDGKRPLGRPRRRWEDDVRMEIGWEVVPRKTEMKNSYNILYEKRGGKRPLGRPKRRWEDNFKVSVKDIG